MTEVAGANGLTFDHVLAARTRIGDRLERTPTRRSLKLETLTGAREVWLKLDLFHRTGSFKERGAANALLSLDAAARAAGVVAASAGNHAQALAYHAKLLGISAKIVMPVGTPLVKVEGTKHYDAEVILKGEVYDDALEEARRLVETEGRTLISAFDNWDVMAGQATATLELLEDAQSVDLVVSPVGGGGLISGALVAAEGVRGATGRTVDVVGVEAAMYPSFRRALEGGQGIAGGDTLAEGIAIKRPGERPLSVARGRLAPDDVLLVDEATLEEAVVRHILADKLTVEGAGAAPLAALLEHPERFQDRCVGLLVCGGNIDVGLLGQVLARHLVRSGRRARIRVECSDRPGRLAEITEVLDIAGANVIDVQHDRLSPDVPAKETRIDVVIETDHPGTMTGIVDGLHAKGFKRARIIDPH